MPQTSDRTAAQALVDQLVIQGVRHVFCVPGESYLAVLDALRDSPIEVTVCRQEGGAAMMADAHGKATGRPGVCFVTRGPGATNASAGVHVSDQDSTPMILFVGQVDLAWRGRQAWQELDYRAVFGSMTKWATELERPERVAETVARAFHVAMSGRPGPVVVALPRNVLNARVQVADVPRVVAPETSPGAEEMAELARRLAAAERPMVLLGGSRWSEPARAVLHAFAERTGLPVATSHRRLVLLDPLHPNYAGDLGLAANPKLVARVKAADLVLSIGGRLGELPSQGYTLFADPPEDGGAAGQALVMVYPDAEELGRVRRPTLAIHATPARFVAALDALPLAPRPEWRAQSAQAHADYLDWSETPTPQPGAVNLGAVMAHLREVLPPDAAICHGAGNFAGWINRFYRFRRFGTHFAPLSGSMGYGVPAAVGIKRLHPERTVVCIAGDGDFLMNGQEFATAVQYGLPFVTVVVDNACYGTIRAHQEREFPGRVVATDLRNPDFAAYARAFGGFGVTVERTEDFAPAFAAAQASGVPAIVHLKVDPEAITLTTTLSQIRAAGRSRD